MWVGGIFQVSDFKVSSLVPLGKNLSRPLTPPCQHRTSTDCTKFSTSAAFVLKTIRLGIRSCSRGGGWIKICGVNLIPWNRRNWIGAQNQIQKRVITSTISRMPQSLVRCEFAFKLSGFVDQLLRADWWNEFWRKKCVNNGNFTPSPCPDYSKRINTAVLGLCKVCLKGACLPLWEIPEMGLTASTQSSHTDRAISYTAKEYIICYNQ